MTYTEIVAALDKERSSERRGAFRRTLPQSDRLALSLLQEQAHWKGFADWFYKLAPEDQNAFFESIRHHLEGHLPHDRQARPAWMQNKPTREA
jgi:hypothetical protein